MQLIKTTVTIAAMASASYAFAPLHPSARPVTSIGSSQPADGYYFMEEKTPEPVSPPSPKKQSPPKAATKKKAAAGGHGSDGIFSPVVLFVKDIWGDEKSFNKFRANVISKHSDVISNFVKTSETEFGKVTLKQLFHLADKDSNGTICEDELKAALQTLGFTHLKEKQIKGIFARADKDGNGSIDMEEWFAEAPVALRTNLIKLAKKNGGELGFLA